MTHARPSPSWMTAAVAMALVLPASAESDALWATVQRLGVSGTWARDCETPAARNAPWTRYFQGPDGGPRYAVDFGQAVHRGTVEAVRQLTPTRLEWRLRPTAPEGPGRTSVLELRDGLLHSVSAILADGTEIIRDGRTVPGGQLLPPFRRCGD